MDICYFKYYFFLQISLCQKKWIDIFETISINCQRLLLERYFIVFIQNFDEVLTSFHFKLAALISKVIDFQL